MEIVKEYDVAVCGGGIAGISAALAASRQGKKVVLFEKEYLLGGLATSGLVTIYLPLCDGLGHQVSFGIAEELLKLSIKYGAEANYPENWLDNKGERTEKDKRYSVQYNAQLFALLSEELLMQNGVEILYGSYVVDVECINNKINKLYVENKSGRLEYEIKSVVDATGDLDIAKFAKAPTEVYEQENVLAAWYYFVDEKGYPAWNSAATETGLQLLRDFVMPSSTSLNKHPITKAYNAEYDVGKQPFATGECIFKLLGPWEYLSDVAEFDKLLANDGGSSNIKTISLSNLFAKDPSKDYASKVKGEGHAFMMLSTVESTTKKCASMIFADWMVNNAGIKWAERGHLPSLKSVENSEEYRNSTSYNNYIKNWGTCDDYVVIQPTPYYSTIDNYFKACVQQSMATQFKDLPIRTIIEDQEEDCIGYIELYA